MPRAAAKQQAVVVYAKPPVKKRVYKKPTTTTYARIPRVMGSGDYTYDKPGPWGRIGSSVGRTIGGALGAHYGLGKAGAAIGQKLGSYAHYIGKIFGSGDYVTASAGVRSNTLMSDAQAPQFAGQRTVRIRHREYLGDIITSDTPGAFRIQAFSINPGLAASYPWLSQVCGATYQQYRINGQVYEFRSMSSDALNSTNTALGQVIMATDYDSKDNPFTSKQQMENTMFGVSCKPSACMIHAIECARNQTAVSELYVRPFAVPDGADPRLYDLGTFYVATNGMQGSSVNVGELWVTYDVTLFKEIQQPPLYIAPSASYDLIGVDNTHPEGTAQTKIKDQIGLRFIDATTVEFPLSMQKDACYMVTWCVQGTAAASVPAPGGGTPSGGLSQYAFLLSSPEDTITTNTKGMVTIVRYDGTGTVAAPPRLSMATGVVPTALTFAQMSFTQVSSGYPPG